MYIRIRQDKTTANVVIENNKCMLRDLLGHQIIVSVANYVMISIIIGATQAFSELVANKFAALASCNVCLVVQNT